MLLMLYLVAISPSHMPEGDWRYVTDPDGGHGVKNSQEAYADGYACQLKCASFPFKYLMQPVRTGTRFGRRRGR